MARPRGGFNCAQMPLLLVRMGRSLLGGFGDIAVCVCCSSGLFGAFAVGVCWRDGWGCDKG